MAALRPKIFQHPLIRPLRGLRREHPQRPLGGLSNGRFAAEIFLHPLMRAAARPQREHPPKEPQNGRSAASEEPLRQNPPKSPYKAAARPPIYSSPQPPIRPLRGPHIISPQHPYEAAARPPCIRPLCNFFPLVSKNMRIFAAGNGYQTGAPRPRPRHHRRVQIIPIREQGVSHPHRNNKGHPTSWMPSSLYFQGSLDKLAFPKGWDTPCSLTYIRQGCRGRGRG